MRIFLICCLSLLAAAEARAQTVTLTPSVIELRGTFGQSTTQTLHMTNSSSRDLTFEMTAQDVVTANGRRMFIAAGDLPHSIAATAVFSPPRITIPARSSRAVVMTVTVPPGTESRAIVALFKGVTRLTTAGTSSTVSLGTLLTFTLSDDCAVSASDLFVLPQSPSQNAAFEVALNNGGAEPVTPKGIVVILDAAGTLVGKVAFAQQRLLPGERLHFKTQYPGELRKGEYRVLSTFDIGGRAMTRTSSLVVR